LTSWIAADAARACRRLRLPGVVETQRSGAQIDTHELQEFILQLGAR
jgi:hypothetical protein